MKLKHILPIQLFVCAVQGAGAAEAVADTLRVYLVGDSTCATK